jgi:hypothetical protein
MQHDRRQMLLSDELHKWLLFMDLKADLERFVGGYPVTYGE